MASSVSAHEAAHVVACEHLGAMTASATIMPTAGYGGLVSWREPAMGHQLRRRMYVRGVIALSGAVAESNFSGLPLRQLLEGDDLRDAREAATAIALSLDNWSPGTRGRVFARLLNEARELVAEHWHAILEVARALEYGKTLNGAQVARIVHFASKRKDLQQ